jgi:TRAP-type C4-dicarboxylate transport system permease small subunit
VWLIVLAITEILLRLAALVAFIFVLVGGVKLMTSQGNSKGTESGRETVINALIGLAISVFSAAIVAFIAGRFK